MVHLFTASGAIIGLFSIKAIIDHHFISMFWLAMLAIVVDGVDGSLARLVQVKQVVPAFDGALLDNIVDYLNYVMVPAVFVLLGPLFVAFWRCPLAIIILLASAFQFCQSDAKTQDHFFKGFPSYWNILILYLYYWNVSMTFNFYITVGLVVMVFVPIKYVYPSRLDFVSDNPYFKQAMLVGTIIWWLATAGMLYFYPTGNLLCSMLSLSYVFLYLFISFYRTFVPLAKATIANVVNRP